MKKIILSTAALLFAGASVFANPTVPVAKKAKQSSCTSCSKAKCTSKASCPKVTSKCVCS